jgi:hypothetical protein
MAKKNPQEFPECAKLALLSANFALVVKAFMVNLLFYNHINSGTRCAIQGSRLSEKMERR